MSKEITCSQMVRYFKRCQAHYPISDRYINAIHDSPDKTGRDEKEHMIAWFGAQRNTGTGPYSRRTPNYSAKTCYNRLLNAASLLWIAEAAGVSKSSVQKAFDAASSQKDYRSACKAVRQVIPWSLIEESISINRI